MLLDVTYLKGCHQFQLYTECKHQRNDNDDELVNILQFICFVSFVCDLLCVLLQVKSGGWGGTDP